MSPFLDWSEPLGDSGRLEETWHVRASARRTTGAVHQVWLSSQALGGTRVCFWGLCSYHRRWWDGVVVALGPRTSSTPAAELMSATRAPDWVLSETYQVAGSSLWPVGSPVASGAPCSLAAGDDGAARTQGVVPALLTILHTATSSRQK